MGIDVHVHRYATEYLDLLDRFSLPTLPYHPAWQP
jgi:hypothetical protein